MSSDFWASYVSGAVGILLGNHLDVLKVQAQAGTSSLHGPSVLQSSTSPSSPATERLRQWTHLFRGAAAPIIGYGALNSVLFMTFNRTLKLMDPSIFDYTKLAGVESSKIWAAGALGGLATWVISAPSELIKCRTQLLVDGEGRSWSVMRDVLRREGIGGLYRGGVVTSLRDGVGYGWYFWSCMSSVSFDLSVGRLFGLLRVNARWLQRGPATAIPVPNTLNHTSTNCVTDELCKRLLLSRQHDPFVEMRAWETLVAGGIAGVVTWVSIYPLDVVKTRLQTRSVEAESQVLLGEQKGRRKGSSDVAKEIWRKDGLGGFYRGVGICSLRAFVVNAVQWYAYEQIMAFLRRPR